MYTLNKWADEIAPHATGRSAQAVQHTIAYVARGQARVNGETVDEGGSAYVQDWAAFEAGAEGATLWRWGLVPDGVASGLLEGEGVSSAFRMTRRVKMFEMMPTSDWLFRLDCVLNFEGTTGMHSHPGSGIRCMLDGTLKAESRKGESGYASRRGDVWYEEGAYPLVSTVDPGGKSTFLRGMILPPEYHGRPDTASWIDGFKATYDGSTVLQDVVVTLR